jgi:hypothetical protein
MFEIRHLLQQDYPQEPFQEVLVALYQEWEFVSPHHHHQNVAL